MPRLVTASALSPAAFPRCPATHSPARKASATSTPYVCRNERWKISGYMRRLPFRPQQIEQQQSAAEYDRGVRHVERGPLVVAHIEEQKISHAPICNAVEDVARRAAENQGEAP